MTASLLYCNFQQCTGVDDLETCMAILEHHGWNLQVIKCVLFLVFMLVCYGYNSKYCCMLFFAFVIFTTSDVCILFLSLTCSPQCT